VHLWEKRQARFHKIYAQVSSSPGIPIYEIADTTGMSRNTVSRYLQEMYRDTVLIGPQIRLLPALNYREYVYLMNFKNPFHFFQNVRGFPHVLYNAMTFGNWNSLVVTDGSVDFSQLVGFEKMVFRGIRYRSYTPQVEYTSWVESFKTCSREIRAFSPHIERKTRTLAGELDWGTNEWNVYRAFKYDTRKTATTTLKKIGVRYETYVKWMEDLESHCSHHTGFYPGGYPAYLTSCFLFSTDYEQTVGRLFSCFPTTPFIVEVGDSLMILMSSVLSELKRTLFSCVYDMKTQGIIKSCNHAAVLFHSRESYLERD
jgi:DNA-binding Lrp family transcriptional regulator